MAVGFFGPVTGDDAAAVGIDQGNAVALAIDQFDTAHRSCEVAYLTFDTRSDPAAAANLAQSAGADPHLVAVVGPALTAEIEQAEPIFNTDRIPTITASATDPALSANHWTVFHRAIANDNAQGPAIARLIATTLKAHSAAIVDDGSNYGKQLAGIVRQQLDVSGIITTSPAPLTAGTETSTVQDVKTARPDAVFFAGAYPQAGPLALQLKSAGITAAFISDDQSLNTGFIQDATPAGADGAYLTSPIAYALTQPQDQPFVTAYTTKYHAIPGPYAAEAYDATNHILAAIAAGNYTRSAINTYVSNIAYHGIIKTYAYDSTGELKGAPPILVHQVVNGQITLIGLA